MFATLFSAAPQGVEAEPVRVEVNSGEVGGLRFVLVGLPGTAVRNTAASTAICFVKPRQRTAGHCGTRPLYARHRT
jgi:magnesium chelatase family protein